jgi:hypothetical protein
MKKLRMIAIAGKLAAILMLVAIMDLQDHQTIVFPAPDDAYLFQRRLTRILV